MMPLLRNAVILLAVLVGLVFGYFNTVDVPVDYLFDHQDMPLVLVLSIALLVGLSLGIIICIPAVLRQRAEVTTMKRKLQHAEAEVKNLRNLPLNDG